MTTKIRCEFIGGPKDGQIAEMQVEQFAESLVLKSDGWIAVSLGSLQRFEPHDPIPKPTPANWHSYVCSIYQQVHKLHPPVIYWYMRDKLIERCEAVIDGTRYMNEAMAGHPGCARHPYGNVDKRRFGLCDRRKCMRAPSGGDEKESW